MTDSPDIVHAKMSYQQCSEVGTKNKHAEEIIHFILKKFCFSRCGCCHVVNDNRLYVFTLQRLYKSGKNDDMHKYTLHPDDPDFVRAKINAQQISDVRQLNLG